MENFYFCSSKWKEKWKEVKQTSETSAKQGYLIQFPSSFGCRGVAGRGARRQRGLQGVPQPVANSLNDELRFFQMTILRWVDHSFPLTIVNNGPTSRRHFFLIFNPLNIVYKPRRYEQSRSRRNESIERSKRLPRKLDYGFQFETFSFPESRRKILTGSRSRREQNLVSNRERCRTKTPWKHDLRRSYNRSSSPNWSNKDGAVSLRFSLKSSSNY